DDGRAARKGSPSLLAGPVAPSESVIRICLALPDAPSCRRKCDTAGALAVSVEFLVTSFIIIVSPGTGVLYTVAAGLSRGSRANIVAAFGCTIGIVPHMAAAIMG